MPDEGEAMHDTGFAAPRTLAELDAEAARLQLSPGWIARDQPIFWAEPKSQFVPAHWRFSDVRGLLDAAGRLVDMSLAERRILALRNPFPGNNFATTRTLSCSYQLMLPGERASTHRHASHALRVMLDARRAWSIVDGVRMPMETGDIVLTPGRCWHGHGLDGDDPACWLDGLDIPLTHLLEPMFFEPHPDRFEPARSVVETSPFRYSRADIARALDAARPDAQGLAGPRITLACREMAALGMTVERLSAGESTRRQRSTASRCFVVMEGAGRSKVGTECFDWQRGDTIAVPTWTWFEHAADADAQLFCLSDEPLMQFTGYLRQEAA